MTDVNLSELICIIDRSGSMAPFIEDTIHGFNTFLEDQKKQPGEVKITLALFDHEYNMLYNGIDVKDCEGLNITNYTPRGSTALFDAICNTIDFAGTRLDETQEELRPSKILCTIITDGKNNDSKKFNLEDTKSRIKHQTEKYNWKFIYLGSNLEAFEGGLSLGITHNIQYDANQTIRTYSSLGNVATTYRSTGNVDLTDFEA